MDKPQYLVTTDEEGNIFKRVLYRGRVLYERFPIEIDTRLDAVREFKCRPDDIVIGSYPKSGLHWVSNIVRMLSTGEASNKGSPKMLEFEDLGNLEKMTTQRVFTFHMEYDLLPLDVQQNVCKVIHLVRNPKDVAVSHFEYLNSVSPKVYIGNFNGFLKLFMDPNKFYFGSWFGNEKTWCDAQTKYPDRSILLLKYEDLKTNLYQALVTLNDYLGFGRSESFLKEVEQNVSFQKLKTQHEAQGFSVGSDMSEFVKETSSAVLPVYRKGIIGDWKNYFTVAQNELFDKVYAEQMSGYDLQLQFE